jgi:hypothetical protein
MKNEIINLTDKYFLALQDKYFEMYKVVNPMLSIVEVADILMKEISIHGYMAYGIFRDNIIKGVIAGYPINNSFFVSVVVCDAVYTKELFAKVEYNLKTLGYKSWTTQAKAHIKSLAPKLGANIDTIIYTKEI